MTFNKKILGSLVLTTLLASCGSSEKPVSKENNKTKEITVYTALENEQIPEYLQSFKEQYPNIKLNIVRESTGVIVSRVLAEKDNPQADVVWGTAATGLLVLDEANLLKEYSPKDIEKINPKFKDNTGKDPKWVGNNAWMTAISVNTIEMKKLGLEEPKNFSDLLKPEYKGLISMPNPASSGTGFLTVSALVQLLGEEKAWEYMASLDNNMGVYTHSGSKPAKTAASGEYPIGISYGYPGIKIKNDGAPINVYFPNEGSGWDSEANALINKKNIKDEAKVFLDWAISEDAMKMYAKSYAIVSRDINVAPPKGFPENPINQLIANDFSWAAANKERILTTWETKFGSKTEKK
ncbi:putative 2-aminoethylphosphonate ABC transporter substrate-binding protein [Cetobacterium somerae]|uniref:putative 2-aminoethylphosphonate ABC transporter substrate-binding protein n=1 Tax=Cetobacterium somerae TaxID=188913 RepID=UPI001F059BDA|nr:putative 2-aminoethylphosphonate ABC transporter substrate-binding protein [Cetobacterium somerae]UPO96549.1 putative 2-aminoethylphosphonate ABC transporter substrate-binding protein [Cetobacterium somerae]